MSDAEFELHTIKIPKKYKLRRIVRELKDDTEWRSSIPIYLIILRGAKELGYDVDWDSELESKYQALQHCASYRVEKTEHPN